MQKKTIMAIALSCLGLASTQAASSFIVSPNDYAPLTVGASPDLNYIVGTDEMTQLPIVWDVRNNDLQLLVYASEQEGVNYLGAFNDVTNDGVLVGKLSDDVSNQANALSTHVSDLLDITFLAGVQGEDGSEAKAISADGKTIAGYYNSTNVDAQACVWVAGARKDLPTPAADALGFTPGRTKALYMSDDAKVIAGTVEDKSTGYGVLIIWTLQDGQYVAKTAVSTLFYGKTHAGFQPTALSPDGNWVLLQAKVKLAPGDWESCDMPQAARLNLSTYELATFGDACKWAPLLVSIANDGTAVGYTQAGMDPEDEEGLPDGVIWKAGTWKLEYMSELYAQDDYFSTITASKLTGISADGKTVVGYAGDAEANRTVFRVTLKGNEPIHYDGEFVISPIMADNVLAEVSMLGECMSTNRKYVGGTDEYGLYPALWDTEEQKITLIIVDGDSIYVEPAYDEEGELIEEGYWQYGNYRGDIHAINDEGIAVGILESNFSDNSHSFYYDIHTGEVTYLAEDKNFSSHNAWGMTADGETVVGYAMGVDYSNPENPYLVRSCIWTEHGTKLTYLPVPTKELCGFPVDYAEARWISEDGSVIYGFVQDGYTGSWVAIHWLRNEAGEYVPQALLPSYYTYTQTEAGDKYYMVEPRALSANGEWVSLIMQLEYDAWDWDAEVPAQQAARMNLKSGELEFLDLGEGITGAPEFFGIANNGRAVGRFLLDAYTNAGVIWYEDEPLFTPISGLNSTNEYVQTWVESNLSCISADGNYVLGQATSNIDGEYISTAFYVDIPGKMPESIGAIHTDKTNHGIHKTLENSQLLIIKDGKKYTITGLSL